MRKTMAELTLTEILKGLDEREQAAVAMAELVRSDDIPKPANYIDWTVILHKKDQPSRQFPLVSVLNIGRSAGSDILLPDKWISRQHARIELVEGKPRIIDLGSGNGTFVDGKRISGPVWLDESSVVSLGSIRLEVTSGDVEDGIKTGDFSIQVPVQPG
ncbi:MAG: FHA domain-containing protein [Anaerolineales bacterium]|nr:FHA domain-containing protein [Anaerolineales bacterium]